MKLAQRDLFSPKPAPLRIPGRSSRESAVSKVISHLNSEVKRWSNLRIRLDLPPEISEDVTNKTHSLLKHSESSTQWRQYLCEISDIKLNAIKDADLFSRFAYESEASIFRSGVSRHPFFENIRKNALLRHIHSTFVKWHEDKNRSIRRQDSGILEESGEREKWLNRPYPTCIEDVSITPVQPTRPCHATQRPPTPFSPLKSVGRRIALPSDNA